MSQEMRTIPALYRMRLLLGCLIVAFFPRVSVAWVGTSPVCFARPQTRPHTQRRMSPEDRQQEAAQVKNSVPDEPTTNVSHEQAETKDSLEDSKLVQPLDEAKLLSNWSEKTIKDSVPNEPSASVAHKQEEPPKSSLEDSKLVEPSVDEAKLLSNWSEKTIHESFFSDAPTIPFDVIFERTLDTVEDAVVHLRRIPYDLGWLPETPPDEDKRQTIVVLGSGWAAHALLKVADTYKLRVFVVSPSNHFVFTPMLASASVGTVEYRSMTEAVRAANPMIENYIEGQAVDVDIRKKVLKVQLNSLLEDTREGAPPLMEIPYDKLLVACGCKVADDLVPGAKEYCLRLKTCDDARKLRNSVGECLEFASRPDVSEDSGMDMAESERDLRRKKRRQRAAFVIVGGGPTGVELAGELTDFLRDITRPRVGSYPRLRDDVCVYLLHGGSELVAQFDPELRRHALESLEKIGVKVMLNTKVMEVGDGYVKFASKETPDQVEKLCCGLTVWAAGTAPVQFVKTLLGKLPESANNRGKVNVDSWLRCPTPDDVESGSILVMGDAASFAEENKKDSFLPQTAQVAGQQGAYAARLLCRDYDLSATPAPVLIENTESTLLNQWLRFRGLEQAPGFEFLNLGLLAYVGSGEALSQVQIGDFPIASYAGSISYVLWRSVYLVKQVATRNRVLVTFDWLKSSLFGRDITRL